MRLLLEAFRRGEDPPIHARADRRALALAQAIIAAEDLEIYFSQLREDQIVYVNPGAGMPIERTVEITGGQRVVIVADPEEPLPVVS